MHWVKRQLKWLLFCLVLEIVSFIHEGGGFEFVKVDWEAVSRPILDVDTEVEDVLGEEELGDCWGLEEYAWVSGVFSVE